jgi:hypothetical protein
MYFKIMAAADSTTRTFFRGRGPMNRRERVKKGHIIVPATKKVFLDIKICTQII